MRRRSGFTFVELLITMTVIGILSAVALPKFRDVKRRAAATQILGDFDVMRHATLSFYADSGYYPVETGPGAVPPNLTRYLPNGFKMTKPEWQLDYENWSMQTKTFYKELGVAVGVSFRTSDAQLGATAMKLIGNAPSYSLGERYTFLIAGF
jgi:prepilin-type N-terminal cleavage/methylation domain-containing protein